GASATRRYDQQVRVIAHDVETGDEGVFAQGDAAHAGRVAAHGADLLLAEAHRLAIGGGDDQLIAAGAELDPVQLVTLGQVDGDQAVAPNLAVEACRRLLDGPLLGDHHQVAILGPIGDTDHRGDLVLGVDV